MTGVRQDRDMLSARVADDTGMRRIARLPPNVVNRIAAGEVVERPASVVKELLENALDADATRIDVAVEQGGVGLVRVVDDGGGIEAEDLPLAVMAHATSKLRVAEDLERIGTLGFRGEALASIGSVARLVVRSRRPGAAGAVLEVDHGTVGAVTPDGGAVGTTVEVHQLFGRVPARRAFLRSPHTEWSHAAEAFVRVALAHPEVAFTLSHNGRRVHDLSGNGGRHGIGGWRPRIDGIFGPAVSGRLIDVEGDDGEIVVAGLVGRPEDDQPSSRLQHLFVNGRPFRDRALLHAVQEAYRGLLLSGRHPIVFLRFEMPPEMVDVNVHPSKMEVRFREPARLYRLVLATLRTRFLAADMTTRLSVPAGRPSADVRPAGTEMPLWKSSAGPPAVSLIGGAPAAPDGLGTTVGQGTGSAVAASPMPWQEADVAGPAMRAVQMHDRYIVVESPAGIEVIDQHALHERVLYERFRADVAEGGLEVQRLLVPERVELTATDLETVQRHAAALERAGMRLEPFGGSTVIVTATPALAGRTPAAELVREVLDRLASATAAGRDASLLVDEVLHGLACRAAIKAGDRLSQAEVDALVRDRGLVPNTHHCPHGRPTSLTLSRQELDRQFRRT